MDLNSFLKAEFGVAGFKSKDEINKATEAGSNLVHPVRDVDYGRLDQINLSALLEVVKGLSEDFNAKVDLNLKTNLLYPTVAMDAKVHNNFLFIAVYFVKNKNIENICVNHGFFYAEKKNIWVKKMEIPCDGLSSDMSSLFHLLLAGFLLDIRAVCTVIILMNTYEKFFQSKLVD